MTMQTFTGKQYLKIDIASNFGLDKKRWDERLAWFDENEHQLDLLIAQAKEPALFYAGIQAWKATLRGEPTGYMISLDATSSGLQLLAALTCDDKAAKLCNVIDTGDREDAYTNIYQEMVRRIGGVATIQQTETKRAIMTSLYASTAVPKEVFGEGALLDIYYQTISDLAPAAWELNEAMLGLWNPDAYSHDWILPDNFHVKVKVMSQSREMVNFLGDFYDVVTKVNAPMEEGRSLGANTIHSVDGLIVRELTRRCDYDPEMVYQAMQTLAGEALPSDGSEDDEMVGLLWDHYQRSGYLSARILQHLKPTNVGGVLRAPILELLESLPSKPFKVVSNHDCFRMLPNYGNQVRQQYNLQLQLIAKSNLLSDIISQLVGRSITVGKLQPNLWKAIEHSNYALS